MKIRIERSYLVRKIEEWEVEVPDTTNVGHAIDQHLGEFDDDLVNRGTVISEEFEFIDNDDLGLLWISTDQPDTDTNASILAFNREGHDG